ncbi:TPA: energy-coupling factor transporter transmembrane protein EcfT [Candidatus Woesearchaeota archaeon]|nr:energy-coupling factor transporter transmembrane protein EcfT [Candidatus Woesearchaeota archaeon]HII68570.1 energy-coupling factor transporter transmembrane protein EcfT [Candidatus Woesearchaeota archaeon]
MPRFIGEYTYKDTLLHNLAPQAKILMVVFASALLFLMEFSKLAFILIILCIAAKSAGIAIWKLGALIRPFLALYAMILIFYFIFSPEKMAEGLLTVFRFIILIMVSHVLLATTSISALVRGFESLAWPVKAFGASPRTISFMLSLTIRFIPVLFLEADTIHQAQRSRCSQRRKLRSVSLLVASVVQNTSARAAAVADAVASRCYRTKGTTSINSCRAEAKDWAIAAGTLAVMGFLLWYG